MKLFVDFLAGLVAMLAAAALSQFGIDLTQNVAPKEIKRINECASAPADPDADKPRC